MTGYIDYNNLNAALQEKIDDPSINAIRVNEGEFINISVPRTGLFIVIPEEGVNYLPTRDNYAILSVVELLTNSETQEQFYVRTSFAMRITLEDVNLPSSTFVAHRIFNVNARSIPFDTWIPLDNEYELVMDINSSESMDSNAILSGEVGLQLMSYLNQLGNFENGVFIPKTLNTSEIEGLQDYINITNELQNQLNAISTGLNYIGSFDTLQLLNEVTGSINGDLAVVTNMSNDDASELYVYQGSASAWIKLGKFQFTDTFIGLKDTPLNYANSLGKVLKSTGTGLEFGQLNYNDLQGKPTVSTTQLETAVTNSHTHSNKAVLDLLQEDALMNLTYRGNSLSSQWKTFEF